MNVSNNMLCILSCNAMLLVKLSEKNSKPLGLKSHKKSPKSHSLFPKAP